MSDVADLLTVAFADEDNRTRPAATVASSTVYASEGGRRFHKDRACPTFLAAHDLWRFDPMQWVPGMPQIMLTDGHPLREMTLPDAFGRGKEPCTTCYPGLRGALYRGHCENDFGHEPFEYDGVPICIRCYTRILHITFDATSIVHRRYVRQPVLWPCTSAVILGLAEREVTA